MKAIVTVSLKKAILDPQGKAIAQALHTMGFDSVADVRAGKSIEIQLPTNMPRAEAEQAVKKMCEGLLANPVMEDYKIDWA